MHMDDVERIRWPKPGMASRVNVHTQPVKSLEQDGLRCDCVLCAKGFGPVEDPADETDFQRLTDTADYLMIRRFPGWAGIGTLNSTA